MTITDLKARVTDPETSKQAGARHQGETMTAAHARVLAMFRTWGPMTDKGLGAQLWDAHQQTGLGNMSPSGIRSRRSELVKMGKLRDSGRVENVDGYNCTVWEVVP